MRTKANIVPAGGIWSTEVAASVPPQPSQVMDEDFNITTYRYRYTAWMDHIRVA